MLLQFWNTVITSFKKKVHISHVLKLYLGQVRNEHSLYAIKFYILHSPSVNTGKKSRMQNK